MDNEELKLLKIRRVLHLNDDVPTTSVIKEGQLMDLVWSGCPKSDPYIRGLSWEILLKYRPVDTAIADNEIRKQQEAYLRLRQQVYSDVSPTDPLLKDIYKDLPRTQLRGSSEQISRLREVLQLSSVTKLLERILYVWSREHPECGYVQGLNDICLPFLLVLLGKKLNISFDMLSAFDVECLFEKEPDFADIIEADVYNCFSKLLLVLMENYLPGQPGVLKSIKRIHEILQLVDKPLCIHLEKISVDLLHLCFRWINCLFVRELPLDCVIRIWDSEIAEGKEPGGLTQFYTYLCVVYLGHWSPHLCKMNFEEVMLFSQQFPTNDWTCADIEALLAEAYVLKSLYHSAPGHFK